MIYLDNNATTRVLPEVWDAMSPYFCELYFNPTSAAGALHGVAKPLVEAGRAIANLIGCFPDEVILTSGATESNNWVLQSTAHRAIRESGRCHIVVSAIEHPSVLEVASSLAEKVSGVEVSLVPVTRDGIVDLEAFKALIRTDTALISVMLANNETGVIQPVAEAAAIAKKINPACLVHTDATQAVGKIMFSLQKDLHEVDCLSLSAHKFHGPKGVGALFIRNGIELDPLLFGGGQQAGARSGTENPALAAGIAKASEMALSLTDAGRIVKLRDSIESALADTDVMVLGTGAPRLPNTSLLLFPDADAETLILQLLAAGFAISNGSACSSGSERPSHVVLAMGIKHSSAFGAVRVSLSHETSQEDVARFVGVLVSLVGEAGVRAGRTSRENRA